MNIHHNFYGANRIALALIGALIGITLSNCGPLPGFSYDAQENQNSGDYRVWNLRAEPGIRSVLLSWEDSDISRLQINEPLVYHVYSGSSETGSYTLLTQQTGETSFLHTGLAKGQSQWYKIVPRASGDMSGETGVAKAVPVRGSAFGAPPEPPQVISDYSYNSRRYINISWDMQEGCRYYGVDVYSINPSPVFIGGITIEGSQIFSERNILWDPGSTGNFCFVLYGVFDIEREREDAISYPSGYSEVGHITELN